MTKYKLSYFYDFKNAHDNYLGSFHLSKVTAASHPFVISGYEAKSDQLTKMERMGWSVIAVEGDGNCAYYCFILGLENNDNKRYSVFDFDESQKDMQSSVPWQRKIIEMREAFQEREEQLIDKQYPSHEANFDFYIMCGFGTEDDINALRGHYVCPDLPSHAYFDDNFRTQDTDYQMQPYWGAAVAASLFEMRVIVYSRMTNRKRGKKKLLYDETTTIIEYMAPLLQPGHLKWTQYPSIHRMSDEEYREKPTIEIVHLGGTVEGAVQHYLFLRRVIYSDTVCPKAPVYKTLRAIIRHESQTTPMSDSETKIDPPTIPNNVRPFMTLNERSTDPVPVMTLNERTTDPAPFMALNERTTDPDTMVVNDATTDPEPMALNDPTPTPIDQTTTAVLPMAVDETTMDSTCAGESTVNEGDGPTSERPVPMGDVDTAGTSVNNDAQDLDDVEISNRESEDDHMPGDAAGDQSTNVSEVEVNVASKKRYKSQVNRKRGKAYTSNKRSSIVKKNRTRKRQDLKSQDAETRLNYDAVTNRFYTSVYNFRSKRYTRVVVQRSVDWINPDLIAQAREEPGTWIAPPIGDPSDRIAPDHIRSKVSVLYEQHNNPFCLTYCMSSALWYCGFREQAKLLSTQAKVFATLHYNAAINGLLGFMSNLAPTIGRPTIYGRRVKGNGKFRRKLTWDDVFTNVTPYPTLIFPITSSGRTGHAICVVDDLIFDSITDSALRLCEESVNWIFNDEQVDINEAFRFNTKCSPRGVKVEGFYRRQVVLH